MFKPLFGAGIEMFLVEPCFCEIFWLHSSCKNDFLMVIKCGFCAYVYELFVGKIQF